VVLGSSLDEITQPVQVHPPTGMADHLSPPQAAAQIQKWLGEGEKLTPAQIGRRIGWNRKRVWLLLSEMSNVVPIRNLEDGRWELVMVPKTE